jgi:hypothetical protein
MSIVIDLSPAIEARLRDKALQRGQDINLMVAELLEVVLAWEEEDLAESIAPLSVQEILASTRGSWGQKTMEEVDRQLADQRQLDWGE